MATSWAEPPTGISREAPVLILRFAEREVRLGGAANAAHNVRALGARVLPIGVVGKDSFGDELLGLFHAAGMPTDGLAAETGRVTPMKTRIMAGGYQATRQQVVRLDREPVGEPQPMTPVEFAAFGKAERAKWAAVVKDAGVRIE